MHIFLFSGIAVSLIISECTGFSPGGIVVAGYLAMFAHQPSWLLGTLATAIVTYGIITLVHNHMLLYGRRLFAVYLLTGIFVSQFATWLLMDKMIVGSGFMVIGYLIPGLIARDFDRQGIFHSVLWIIVAVAITRMIVLAGEGVLW